MYVAVGTLAVCNADSCLWITAACVARLEHAGCGDPTHASVTAASSFGDFRRNPGWFLQAWMPSKTAKTIRG